MAAASPLLDSLSMKVESAVQDLIELLIGYTEEDLSTDVSAASPVHQATGNLNKSLSYSLAAEEFHLHPGEAAAMRQQQQRKELLQEAEYLLQHFSHRNLDTLIRLTRLTLEKIRRRVNSPSTLSYGEASLDDKRRDTRPAFKTRLLLSIPNVGMSPSLEDIQSALNDAAHLILDVFRKVYQWGQQREDKEPDAAVSAGAQLTASKSQVIAKPTQPLRNFYNHVCEHKEVAKLMSQLSTTISSAKMLVKEALERFNRFQDLWAVDRDQQIKVFLESDPTLSEFESEIRRYELLQTEVMEEPEVLTVGALALVTGTHACICLLSRAPQQLNQRLC